MAKSKKFLALTRMSLAPGLLLLFLGTAAALPATALQETAATELKELRLNQIKPDGVQVVIEADGAFDHRVYQPKPEQVVLDIPNVRNPLRHHYPANPHPLVLRVLMYEYPSVKYSPDAPEGPLARVVFELKKPVDYEVQAESNTIQIAMIPRTGESPPDYETPDEEASETGDPTDIPPLDDPLVPSPVNIEPKDVDPHLFFDPSSSQSDHYRLGPEDVVEIRVFEIDQLNRTVRVSGAGSIDLPLIGTIPVQNLTAEQFSGQVADRLRNRYVQNPQVSVFIKEFNSQKVSLLGAVKAPATYPLTGRRNLLQLIAEAGGLSDAGNVLYVFRQAEDGRSARLAVPLNQLFIDGDPRWNIWVQPGDVISVPPEAAISVSVLGAVRNPGIHKLPAGEGATLLKAIALAGGLSERASKGGIQIRRNNLTGEDKLLKVDLGDILSGKAPDVVLQEGDVVVVKESFF